MEREGEGEGVSHWGERVRDSVGFHRRFFFSLIAKREGRKRVECVEVRGWKS